MIKRDEKALTIHTWLKSFQKDIEIILSGVFILIGENRWFFFSIQNIYIKTLPKIVYYSIKFSQISLSGNNFSIGNKIY